MPVQADWWGWGEDALLPEAEHLFEAVEQAEQAGDDEGVQAGRDQGVRRGGLCRLAQAGDLVGQRGAWSAHALYITISQFENKGNFY